MSDGVRQAVNDFVALAIVAGMLDENAAAEDRIHTVNVAILDSEFPEQKEGKVYTAEGKNNGKGLADRGLRIEIVD
tara:strand:+ start:395 stop:622 length:228 start_codon:yes stop_codon:yes gene_type:complete